MPCIEKNVWGPHPALLYIRYGGQYSDLDTVTVSPTGHLENVVGVSGDWVSNANMIFSPQHPLILQLMEAADKRFTGKGWNSIGDKIRTFDLRLVNIVFKVDENIQI